MRKIFNYIKYNDRIRNCYEYIPIILLIISELSLFIIKESFSENYDFITQYLKLIFFFILIVYIYIYIKENIIFNYALFVPLMINITKNKYGLIDANVLYILSLIIILVICILIYRLRSDNKNYYYNSYEYRTKYKYIDVFSKIDIVLLIIYLITKFR